MSEVLEKVDKNGLTEAEYLKKYNPDKWKKPSLTSDICIVAKGAGSNRILLIKRGNHPCLGKWALPGGFSQAGERIEETASRELEEETGIRMDSKALTLVGVYSKPGRDPRDWTVSVAFLACVNEDEVKPIAGDDAADAKWFSISEKDGEFRLENGDLSLTLSDLAFDHDEIFRDSMDKLMTSCE
ncbi:NUDIX domain-containing protein [Butyrivibrio sp. LC3010]|uniref:NUDIX domain-containing protein n=1 Tax=Butyrivibrio sp. LC3010 TaxID=1280680 RepID=UPI00041856F9|nr:NUDIX hydrolase [Butyrivibrio sp. LC3010]